MRLGKARYAAYRATLLRVCPWCAYCGRGLDEKAATLDHVLPKCRGGENRPANLVLACEACNQSKGGDTPAGWALRILRATTAPGQLDDLIERFRAAEAAADDDSPVVLCFAG